MHTFEITEITDEVAEALGSLVVQLDATLSPPSRSHLEGVVNASSSLLLGACSQEGGPIVGMLTLVWYQVPSGLYARIEDVVVDESARRQGLGLALMEAAIRYASRRGAHHVDLTSNPRREAANRLYQRLGFEQRDTIVYRLTIRG